MADNYLITGYWGEPHVTAENDRGINAAMFGAGRYVLPVGEQFRAEYIGNNTVRIWDGKLIDNGAIAGIPAGQYVDLLIPETSQGVNRNDLIVFQYAKDASTLVESGVFVVIHGTETDGTATDPELSQEDLLTDSATFDQMALWRVPVAGAVISDPVKLFSVARNTKNAGGVVVAATSTNGTAYVATVDCVDELYNGLELTIIPDRESASTAPTLNLNGLGAKAIRRRLTSNTATMVQSGSAAWMAANKPLLVTYDGKYWVAGLPRTDVNDLYGVVPIEKGGTGADNVEDARANLGLENAASVQTLTMGEYETMETKSANTLYMISDAEEEESTNAETVSLDFSNWDSGSFTETLSDGTEVEHAVTFDANGNVTSIGGITVSGVS